MEAKDTVMNGEAITELWGNTYSPREEDWIEQILLQQAEISFRAGIREVVDWIEQNTKQFQGFPYFDSEKWEAKLKKWGV